MEFKSACLELLVKRDRGLLREVSDEGYNGLETFFMRNILRNNDNDQAREVPLLLLSYGIDPFQRREPGQKSAFELGTASCGREGIDYIEACIQRISVDLETESPTLGFKELRIFTEFNTTDLWSKFAPMMTSVEDETDQDGWMIDNFLLQAEPRLKFAEYTPPSSGGVKSPTAIIFPLAWQVHDPVTGSGVEISHDGLVASFEGLNNFSIAPKLLVPSS